METWPAVLHNFEKEGIPVRLFVVEYHVFTVDIGELVVLISKTEKLGF